MVGTNPNTAGQPPVQVMPLGAGQDVGKSCVVVSMSGKTVMFDCGMHVGYRDERRFPDFKLLSSAGRFQDIVTCVIITHFHLDHCGALPYFTEVLGYDGPIYATYPTKVLMPIMLEDYHRVMSERQGDKVWYTRQHIYSCMNKVVAVDLGQRVQVEPGLHFTTYYAGHVLGAAMFYLTCNGQTVLYTGDYNTSPERHLGPARVDKLSPDVLISESTYAMTLRDSRRARERDFLQAVHDCVTGGGKVLVPVFAVGRAQELLLLLEEYWERLGLKVPIYFSGGMASRANLYYRLLLNWTNEQVRSPEARPTAFNFPRTQPWDRAYLNDQGACVLFATPGMLHGGTSLEAFKAWAGSERNLVILPGYQVGGTLGSRLANGPPGQHLQVDKTTSLEVRCQVRYLSFSAHADAKGILQMVRQCGPPRTVVLVHGERSRMEFMRDKIRRTFNIPCWTPCNGYLLSIRTPPLDSASSLGQPPAPTALSTSSRPGTGSVPVRVSEQLLCEALEDLVVSAAVKQGMRKVGRNGDWAFLQPPALYQGLPPPATSIPVTGILLGYKEPHTPLPAPGVGQGLTAPTQASGQVQGTVGEQHANQHLGNRAEEPAAFVMGSVPGPSSRGGPAAPQHPGQAHKAQRKQQKQKPGQKQQQGVHGDQGADDAQPSPCADDPSGPVTSATLLSCQQAQRALGLPSFRVILQCEVVLTEELLIDAEVAMRQASSQGWWQSCTGPGDKGEAEAIARGPARQGTGAWRGGRVGADDDVGPDDARAAKRKKVTDADPGAAAVGTLSQAVEHGLVANAGMQGGVADAGARLPFQLVGLATQPAEPQGTGEPEGEGEGLSEDARRVLAALHFLLCKALEQLGQATVIDYERDLGGQGRLCVRSFSAQLQWCGVSKQAADDRSCRAAGMDTEVAGEGTEAGVAGQQLGSPAAEQGEADGCSSEEGEVHESCDQGRVGQGPQALGVSAEDLRGGAQAFRQSQGQRSQGQRKAGVRASSGWALQCTWSPEDDDLADLLVKVLSS